MERKIKKRVSYVIFVIFFSLVCLAFNLSNVEAAGIDGTTIVINPGHGGSWTGCANGRKGLVEKEVTLKIANYIKEELMSYYGVQLILTHDGANFPNNDPSDLAARAMIARNCQADLYVSVHINDNRDTSVNGANVFVTSRTELPQYKEGMTILGNKILQNLNRLGIQNNGVVNDKLCQDHEPRYQYYDGSQADYYADIRHAMRGDTLDDLGTDFRDGSGIPTVLIEHCYINNDHDAQFLDSEEDLRKIAKADAQAIIEYLQLRKVGEVVSEIILDKMAVNLIEGEKTKITAKVGPQSAGNQKLQWSSSDEKVAKVDQEGNVTAITTGKAVITVTSEDNPHITKQVAIQVENYAVTFASQTENIFVGKSKLLEVTISPSWIENKNIIWESSHPEIIEVSKDGRITAKQEGTATIKVTWKDKNLTDEITVQAVNLPEETKIEIETYNVNQDKISGIGQKITKEEFLKHIHVSENLEVEVQTDNEKQTYIGTNTKLIIKEKMHQMQIESYTCLIYGDINGDGKISAMDYTLIKNHIMEVKRIIQENQKWTADVNGDGKISAMDYTLIKNDIMGIKKIPVK